MVGSDNDIDIVDSVIDIDIVLSLGSISKVDAVIAAAKDMRFQGGLGQLRN